MLRRMGLAFLMAMLALSIVACHNKRVQNPLANLGSKQPDVVLFDRAMDALKHNKFDQGRLLLQALISAYPDSEYIARAKLATGDSWYAEGGSAALAQAENEYRDFITFFPNMPEAAEAQMKIADIHYRQMEKPDRDFTHAKRAEEEYRTMILQYPDSPLLPRATQRLREVQEVLADREFLVGRFYFLRESYAAAIARLQSLVDTYPLYSGADEALYMLGNAYERQYNTIKAAPKLNEAVKERMGKEFADKAADAYARIITRYPVMARAEDAKRRLEALNRPVPQPTEAAIAQNKAEEESRSETGRIGRLWDMFHKSPDVAQAAKVGEPTLTDPKQTSAKEIIEQTNAALIRAAAGQGREPGKVSVDVVKDGTPPPNQPVPRSDAPPPATQPQNNGIPELKPLPDPDSAAPASPPPPTAEAQPPAAAAPAQTSTAAAAPATSASPSGNATGAPLPPLQQVNDAATAQESDKASQASDKNSKDSKDKKESSSKKKKKRKFFPF